MAKVVMGFDDTGIEGYRYCVGNYPVFPECPYFKKCPAFDGGCHHPFILDNDAGEEFCGLLNKPNTPRMKCPFDIKEEMRR